MSSDAASFRPPPHAPGRGRARSLPARVALGVGRTVALVLVFVVSLVLGLRLHLDTPLVRRAAVSRVNAVLAPMFQGQIRVDALGELGLGGVGGAEVTILAPDGAPVLVAHGVRVGVATVAALASLTGDSGKPLTIVLPHASVDSLEVRLDTDPQGQLELADAFAPRTASTAPPDPHARGFRIDVPHIAVRHAWAHGRMAGAPPLDVELDDLRAAFTSAPEFLEGDVSRGRITARRIAAGADVTGSLVAHVKAPSAPGVLPDGRLQWEGTAAGIGQTVVATLTDRRLDASVDVPRAEPAAIRALWAASPIESAAHAHVEAHGTLPDVAVVLDAGLGTAALTVTGALSLAARKSATLALEATGVDLHQLAAAAPTSRLGLRGEVRADLEADGSLSGETNLRFPGGALGGNALPEASLQGHATRSAAGALEGAGFVAVEEPGAPTRLDARIVPRGSSSLVSFELQSSAPDLDRVPQLKHAGSGSAEVVATGEVDLGSMRLDARLKASLTHAAYLTYKVESASVDGLARGPLTDPRLEVALRTQGVDAAGVHLTSATVNATGGAMSPYVTVSTRGPDTPDIDASVKVSLAQGLALDAPRVALSRAGERAIVTARSVSTGGGALRVDEARIEGVGQPVTADVAMTPAILHVRAATQGIDLARVGRLAHLEKSLKGGTLALTSDLTLRRDGATGTVTLDLSGASFASASDVDAHLEAKLEGRSVAAKLHAGAGDVGTIDVDAPRIELAAGSALSPRSWRNAWGAVDVDARGDLARASALVPLDARPFDEARGKVHLQVHLARDDAQDMTPDVRLALTTEGLDLTAKTEKTRDIDGVIVFPPPPWHLSGIDLQLDGSVAGKTGEAQLTAKIHDAKGALATIEAGSKRFPWAETLAGSAHLMDDLRVTPVDVHLTIPERALGSVPPILQQGVVTGRLQADVKLAGTLRAPTVDLTAALKRVTVRGQPQRAMKPVDFDVTAHYDGQKGSATIHAQSQARQLLEVQAEGQAAIAQLLDASSATPPAWKASARGHLTDFPLGSISLLDDKMVSGQVSGDLSVDGLHDDARADASLSIDQLTVGSVAYKSARLQLKADGKTLGATLRIDQTDGFFEATAHGNAGWGAALTPSLDRGQPVDGVLSAKNFRVAAALPFLGGTLDELDGRLDADTRAALDPSAGKAQLSGTLSLTRGTVEASAGGGELHDITATVKLAPDGTITLEKLTAKGLSGQLTATGTAHVNGTTLQSAKAEIVIPGRSAIPLSAGGSDLGNVDGRIEVTEATGSDGKDMVVKVEVPQLRVALPEGSTTDAEALSPMEKVKIGAHRGDQATLVLIPLDRGRPTAPASASSSRLTLQTHLAEVEVVKGTELKVELSGNVNVSPTSQVTGQIRLKPGGTLQVQGKKFTVENGTVTFVGADPSNPEVVVKASWDAPDKSAKVFATFDGPLRTGKVTLTSEPGLTQEEIVQLLLFGSADGSQAQTPQGTPANSAIGTAGGEAAQPLNHALSQLGLGAFTAAIDTSQSANPRPELAVQIARDISLQLAIVLGQPPPGVNPDTTLLTVDWRFRSRWSLASTVGNAGSTIFDVLWQRSY